MVKNRVIKNHPAVDYQKPSLIRQEAVKEELRKAKEALKTAQSLRAKKMLRKDQDALRNANKQYEAITKQKCLYKGVRDSEVKAKHQKAMTQWQKAHDALSMLTRQNEFVMKHWQMSQKDIKKAINTAQYQIKMQQWKDAQVTLQMATKQYEVAMKQWEMSQNAQKEARKQYEIAKKQWRKADYLVKEVSQFSEQFNDLIKQWQIDQNSLRNAIAPSQTYLKAIKTLKKIVGISQEDDGK